MTIKGVKCIDCEALFVGTTHTLSPVSGEHRISGRVADWAINHTMTHDNDPRHAVFDVYMGGERMIGYVQTQSLVIGQTSELYLLPLS